MKICSREGAKARSAPESLRSLPTLRPLRETEFHAEGAEKEYAETAENYTSCLRAFAPSREILKAPHGAKVAP